jgi:hypothetical protein
MNPIERRNFLKGTAAGVFALTVDGVEVFLSAREAVRKTRRSACSRPTRRKPSRR